MCIKKIFLNLNYKKKKKKKKRSYLNFLNNNM